MISKDNVLLSSRNGFFNDKTTDNHKYLTSCSIAYLIKLGSTFCCPKIPKADITP
jgi:hypothetical protein